MPAKVRPFYLVCDISVQRRASYLDALNEGLRGLPAVIARRPSVDRSVRFGLITYTHVAWVELPLSRLSQVAGLPALRFGLTAGGPRYDAPLQLLRSEINRDIARLTAENTPVARPTVFFLTAGKPTHEWDLDYLALFDKSQPPERRPHIVAFGYNFAERPDLRQLGNAGAFIHDPHQDPESSLKQLAQSLTALIVDSVDVADTDADGNPVGIIPQEINGFIKLDRLPAELGRPPVERSEPPPGRPATLARFLQRTVNAVDQFLPSFAQDPASPDRASPDQATAAQAPREPAPPVLQPAHHALQTGQLPRAGTSQAPPVAAVEASVPVPPSVPAPKEPDLVQSPRDAEQSSSPRTHRAAGRDFPEPYLGGLPRHWHAVPDTVLDGADLWQLSVRGASLRGSRHRADGVARQDAMGIYPVTADGIEAVLGCVADGVDDEPLSHLGAEQACLILRDEVRARLPQLFSWQPRDAPSGAKEEIDQVWQDLVQSAAERLIGRAALLKVAPGALSASLAVALVETTADDAGWRRWMTFTLGDCDAFLLDGSELDDSVPNAGTCLSCSAKSGDPVFASEDGYCPSCGRRIVAGDTHLTLEPNYVAWDLSLASPLIAGVHAATFPVGSAGPATVTLGGVRGQHTLGICSGGLAPSSRSPDILSQLIMRWLAEQVPTLPEFASQLSFSSSWYTADRTAICFWGR